MAAAAAAAAAYAQLAAAGCHKQWQHSCDRLLQTAAAGEASDNQEDGAALEDNFENGAY